MFTLLAQVTLDDVFKSTQQSMQQTPGSERLVALALGVVAVVVLLVVLQQRRRHQAVPKPTNNPGKLLKEVTRSLPVKSADLKQLKQLADEQSCSDPLVLLLCPSLLAKSIQSRPPDQRKLLTSLVRRINPDTPDKP